MNSTDYLALSAQERTKLADIEAMQLAALLAAERLGIPFCWLPGRRRFY